MINGRRWLILPAIAALWLAPHIGRAGGSEPGDISPRLAPSYWFRVLVPASEVSSAIGYASFRDGPDDVVVFAGDLPVQQDALRAVTGVAAASVVHLPDATILRIPLPGTKSLSVQGSANSFHILVGDQPMPTRVMPEFRDGQILFPTTEPAHVVAVPEADRYRPLLVGTVTGTAALQRVLEGPGYRTLPASSGIVVAPGADDLDLSATPAGFVLRAAGPSGSLPVGHPVVSQQRADAPEQAGGLDLPHGSVSALRARLQREQRQWAAAPPLDRVRQSLRIARTMLALDLGPEAHGVLDAMLTADPAAIDNPARGALLAVADILSDRPQGAMEHWAPGKGAQDERAFWAGAAAAAGGHAQAATRLLAGHLAPLEAAPDLIRRHLDPIVGQALVRAGAVGPARSLVATMPDDGTARLLRAELNEASDHPVHALAAYHGLFDSPDPRVAGIAYFRGTMLQRRLGKITVHDAAARLARHMYDWRGTHHEVSVRLALARLRAQDGAWPEALTGLDRAVRLFPSQAAQINGLRQRLFDRMIASRALDGLPTLAAAAVLQNNQDLIKPGGTGVPIELGLAHRLVKLDLADQASDVLNHALSWTLDDEDRARVGEALARIEFGQKHPHRARKTLDVTAGSDLSPGVVRARAMLAADIAAQIGSPPPSSIVADAGSPNAIAWVPSLGREQRPELTPASHVVAKSVPAVPASGMLDPASATRVLKSAIAASRQDDRAKLARLRGRYLARMPQGRLSAVFATVTSPPLPPKTDLATALAQIAEIERVGQSFSPKPAVKPQ